MNVKNIKVGMRVFHPEDKLLGTVVGIKQPGVWKKSKKNFTQIQWVPNGGIWHYSPGMLKYFDFKTPEYMDDFEELLK